MLLVTFTGRLLGGLLVDVAGYLFQMLVFVVEAVEERGAAADVPGIHPVLTIFLFQQQPDAILPALHTGMMEWCHLCQVNS